MKQIKLLGKKFIRSFKRPPWHSDLMEFQYGLWQGVSAVFTVSGRQLGEENARPFLFNDHIPAKTIICKYDGSRQGHPINMSALRIAMSNFDAALDITKAVVRHHAQAARGTGRTNSPGIWDLYIISLASIALVAYSIRKKPSKNPSAVVPDELASQYQFIAGIFMICRHMIDTNDALILENEPISADQLYAYADQHEIFTSFNGMVCAGSTKKIMDFLEFCTSEMDAAFAKPERNRGTSSTMDGMIDDLDQWYQYAMASIDLDCFIKIERRKSRVTDDETSSNFDRTTIKTYETISDYTSSLSLHPRGRSEGSFSAGALDRQNEILRLLNKAPVKKITQAQLDAQLGYE